MEEADLLSDSEEEYTLLENEFEEVDTSEYFMMSRKTIFNIGRDVINDPLRCFSYFFDESLIDLIVRNTNIKGMELKETWEQTNETEMKCFIGILIYIGAIRYKSPIDRIYSKECGVKFVKLAMTRDRFKELFRSFRCDNKSNRQTNGLKLPAVKELNDKIQNKLITFCQPGEFICVDEKMFKFTGRAKSIQYCPNKPIKRGFKFFCLCTYDIKLCVSLKLYLGKDNNEECKHAGECILRELTETLPLQHFELQADNYFSTIDGLEYLKTRDINYIGTMRQNSKRIPRDVKINQNVETMKECDKKENCFKKEMEKIERKYSKLVERVSRIEEKEQLYISKNKKLSDSITKRMDDLRVKIDRNEIKMDEQRDNLINDFKQFEETHKEKIEEIKQNPFGIKFWKSNINGSLLTSFHPKKTKTVVIATNIINEPIIDVDEDKSYVNILYNTMKTPVDTFDYLCQYYSCKTRTSRYNFAIFQSIIDVVIQNCASMYLFFNKITRSDYLILLAKNLCHESRSPKYL